MDIYLDFNATTPVAPEVVEQMLPFLQGQFGNAASSHVRGRAAYAAVERARAQVADLVGVGPSRVIWTSGSTEALNTALKGLAERRGNMSALVVAATEHKAVLDAAAWLERHRGVTVRTVHVDAAGLVSHEDLERHLVGDVFAVAVMAANNEVGTLQDVGMVSATAQEVGARFVCDTTQAVGKVPVAVPDDAFATVSAHKLYGPQGVGALILPVRGRNSIEAQIHGGGHEQGLRSGTLNLPGIVGFGVACDLASQRLAEDQQRLGGLRDRLERQLADRVGGVVVHGADAPRLSNTTNVHIAGVDADALIVNTPEVAFSSGSACTAAVPTPSHVLTAMGLPVLQAEQSVRLSLGRTTTADDIDAAVGLLAASVERLRELNGAA